TTLFRSYLWLIMPRLLPDNSVEDVQERRRFTARLRVTPGSNLVGKQLDEIQPRLPLDFSFDEAIEDPLVSGQRLLVSGTHDALEEAIRVLKGQVAPGWVVERIDQQSKSQGEDVRVVEMVVTSDSRLIGRTLATSGIADLYGVAVLGIHRPKKLVGYQPQRPQGDLRIQEGDVLLTMGLNHGLSEFEQNDSLLMLEGGREMPRRSKAVLAGAIMVFSVGMASVGLLPIAVSALAGAILMFVTGCVKFDKVGRALSAKVIVLVAASIAIGRVILDSG